MFGLSPWLGLVAVLAWANGSLLAEEVAPTAEPAGEERYAGGQEYAYGPPGYGVYSDVYRYDFSMPDAEKFLFKAGELYLDAAYVHSSYTGLDGNDENDSGAGIGAGYYFSRYASVSAEFISFSSPYLDGLFSASAGLRLPIDHAALAVTGFLGGGYQTGEFDQWNVHIGVGCEVRLTYHFSGIFDVRYVEPETTKSATMYRVGLRFLF